MATALDQRAQSQQFVIAQQANLPMLPFRPNPMLLDLAVVLIGLLVGFFAHLWWRLAMTPCTIRTKWPRI